MRRFLPSRILLPAILMLGLVTGCSRNETGDLRLSGIIEATTVRVSAKAPGQILRLTVDEGDRVHRDSLIAVVETERLEHQIAQSRASLDEIAEQRRALEAQVRGAMLTRDNLSQRLTRFTALLADKAATQQSVDDLTVQRDAANEQIAALRAQIAALESRRAQADAGLGVLETQHRDASVHSPLDGTVLVRYAEQGELLGVGSPVCDIADLGTMWTKVYIEERRLPDIRIGMSVDVLIDGLEGKVLKGIVSWISDKAEFTPKSILTEETRTSLVFPAKVSIANPDGLLKIGMPVTVVVRGVKR